MSREGTTTNSGKRQCCVIDAISIAALCRIEIGPNRAISWMLDDFSVHLYDEALNQAISNTTQLDDDEAKALLRECWQLCYREDISAAHSSFEPWVKNYGSVDRVDRKCASLALELSRLRTHYVILVTDDFRAQPIFRDAFLRYQVGGVYSSYDLLAFIYTRHHEVSRQSCELAIRDLTRILMEDQPADRQKKQKPEIKLEEYVRLLGGDVYRASH